MQSDVTTKDSGLRFDSRITLGNLLEIGTLIVVITTGYYSLKGSQEVIKNQVEQQTTSIQEIKQQYLRADLAQIRQETIATELRYLNQRLDRIEKALK